MSPFHRPSTSKSSKGSRPQAEPSRLDLPVELWLYIAEFMKPEERRKLLGVNRLFFNLAMDVLYRSLSLVSSDIRLFVETMEILKNPIVTQRARSLTIWPESVYEAIHNDKNDWSRPSRYVPPPPEPEKSTIRTWMDKALGRNQTGTTSVIRRRPSPTRIPTILQRKAMFEEALASLTRLEEISVYISTKADVPRLIDSKFLPIHLRQVLWSAARSSILAITLDVPDLALAALLPSPPSAHPNLQPVALQRLDLMLRRPQRQFLPRDNEPSAEEVLIPFAQSLSEGGNLKTLKLSVQPSVWKELATITLPGLINLIIEGIDFSQLSDPKESDIHKFLVNNPSIQDLTLSLSPRCQDPRGRSGNATTDDRPVLPNLTSLILTLPQRPTHFRGLFTYLEHLARSGLTRLRLNSLAHLADIKILLDAFGPPLTLVDQGSDKYGVNRRMRSLQLSMLLLSPEVFSVLAKRCPQLVELKFQVEALSPNDDSNIGESIPSWRFRQINDTNNFLKTLSTFNDKSSPHHANLKNWSLEDLSIMQWLPSKGCIYIWEVMNAIAGVVPSINSFAGQGHTHKAGLVELEPKFLMIDCVGKRSEAWT